jgi:hypothetical protein
MYSINRKFNGKTMKRIGGRSPNPSSITKNKAIKMADAWRSVGLNARVIPNVKGFNVYVGNPRKYYARKGFEDNRGREPKVMPSKKFKKFSNFNFENKPITYGTNPSESFDYLQKRGRIDLIGKEAMIQDLGLFGGVMGLSKKAQSYFDFFDVRQLEDNSIVIIPPKISKIKNEDGLVEYRIERLGVAMNANPELLEIMNAKRIGISGLREDQRFYSKKKEFPTEKEVEDEVQELQWSFDDEIYDEMSWNASFGEGSDEALALFNAGDDDDVLNLYEDLNDEMWEKRAELLYEAGFTQDSLGDIRALEEGRMIGDPKSFESALNIFENNIPTINTGKWKNTNRYGAGLGTDIGMKDLRRIIGNWIDLSVNMAQDNSKRKDAFDREIGRIPELSNFVDPYNPKEISTADYGKYIYNPRYDRWIVGFLTEYNTFYNPSINSKVDAEKFLEALIVAKNDPYAKDLPSIDIDALAIKTLKELDMGELDFSRIVGYRDEQDPASRLNPMFWRASRRANL